MEPKPAMKEHRMLNRLSEWSNRFNLGRFGWVRTLLFALGWLNVITAVFDLFVQNYSDAVTSFAFAVLNFWLVSLMKEIDRQDVENTAWVGRWATAMNRPWIIPDEALATTAQSHYALAGGNACACGHKPWSLSHVAIASYRDTQKLPQDPVKSSV